MRDYNKVILLGNLTRDPEFKEIGGGKQVTNFVIACNHTWTGPEGQQGKEVAFIDCEIWGKPAKIVADRFSKGSPIFVEGRLRLDQWVDMETQKKQSRLRVLVENFSFIDKKPSEESIPVIAGNGENGNHNGEMTDKEFDAL